MKIKSVRGDPNQELCISLEELVGEDDSKDYLQWKCSCWSTKEDFLIEWNVNFPLLMSNVNREEVIMNVSRISFVIHNSILYVVFLWSRSHIWIYCHDIVEFSNMSANGINVSIEPNMFDLEIESIKDNENGYTDNSDFIISLPIKTKEDEFQFVISSESLQLHTLKLNLSGEITKITGISVSSNWWDIATFNEDISDTEEFDRENENNLKNTTERGRPYVNIRNIIDMFSSKWKNSCDDHFINGRMHNLFGDEIYNKKLKIKSESENIVILSFPSIYSKWSVSFLCFITTEKNNSDGSISKNLILFRHDSFGVVEYCWSFDFEQIDDFKPQSLVVVPYLENKSPKVLRNTIKKQINLHLSLGESHLFGLFFVYKSNNAVRLLQLIPSFNAEEVTNETLDSLLSWLKRPVINQNMIYEIINFNSKSSIADIYKIEQIFAIKPTGSENSKSISSSQFSDDYNCIIGSNKRLYLLYITNNGHQLICDNIIDHTINNNKIYFVTYSRKSLYLLVNYQDFPLVIDLNNSGGYLNEHLNLNDSTTAIEEKEQNGMDESNLELNKLLTNYRSKRTRKKTTEKDAYSTHTSGNKNQIILDVDNFNPQKLPVILDYLQELFKGLLEKNKRDPLNISVHDLIYNTKCINVLTIIGEILNNLHTNHNSNQNEVVVLWGKCSIALDFDYWLQFKTNKGWIQFSEGSCFDRITSNFPNLKSSLLESLDISTIFN